MKNKLFGTTWKKCAWIAIICFLIASIGGIISVNYLHDAVANNHVHSEIIIVKNKTGGDSPYTTHFTITDTNNKTYTIVNHEDNYGKKMFRTLEINGEYKVVIKEPEPTDINQFTHILQVYDNNDTSEA